MRLLFFLICVISTLELSAKERFKVIAYQASWSSANKLQYDKLTHINYSFVFPESTGKLKMLPNPELLKSIVAQAHKKKVKVGIAIGGWNNGDDSAFEKFAADPKKRKAFVKSVMALVGKYRLDGVDMDWEYPNPGKSAENFLALIKELSYELHTKKKYLSAAVVSYGATGKGIDKRVFQYLDMLNIMAYDGKEHGLYQQAVNSIDYWANRGCPQAKLILGLPFYGRAQYKSYSEMCKLDPKAHEKDTIGKIRYNGIKTIQQKTHLAMQKCGGVMFWEMSQDASGDKSLLTAIDKLVKKKL